MKKTCIFLMFSFIVSISHAQMNEGTTNPGDSSVSSEACKTFVTYEPDSSNIGNNKFFAWVNQGMLTALADVISYKWFYTDFTDSLESTLANPSFPSNASKASVIVETETKEGCVSFGYIDFPSNDVIGNCSAYIMYDAITATNMPASFQFFAGVDDYTMDPLPVNVVSYTWTFEDANITSSYEKEPVIQFLSDGVKLVTLTAITADSCVSFAEIKVYVSAYNTLPSECYSYFNYNQGTDAYTYDFYAYNNKMYTFPGGLTNDTIMPLLEESGTDIILQYWTFENADISGSYDVNPKVVFKSDGYHMVTLTTINIDSCKSYYEGYVFVGNSYDSTTWNYCQAYMSYIQDTTDYLSVNFNAFVDNGIDCNFADGSDCIGYTAQAEPLSVVWYFQNAEPATSTDMNVTVKFNTAGIHTVTLQTMTMDSCFSKYEQDVYIYEQTLCAPLVDFEILPPSFPGAKDGAIITNQTVNLEYTYTWSNGATSNAIDDVTNGLYMVTVSDPINNCQKVYNYTLENSYQYDQQIVDTLSADPIAKCVNYNTSAKEFDIKNVTYLSDKLIEVVWAFNDSATAAIEEYKVQYPFLQEGNQLLEIEFHCGSKRVKTFQAFVYLNPVKVAILAGIKKEEPNASQAFSVYPNPVQEMLYAEFFSSITTETVFNIYSSEGALVLSSAVKLVNGINHIELPVSDLASGIYMLQTFSEGIIKTVRFVK